MRRTKLLVFIIIIGFISGCSDDSGSECNPACSPGYECVNGACVSACNPVCTGGKVCGTDKVCRNPDGGTGKCPDFGACPICKNDAGVCPDSGACPKCRDGGICPDTGGSKLDPFIKISGKYNHFCGLRQSGKVECWDGKDIAKDGETTPPTDLFKDISAGMYMTCGITAKDTLKCWGNSYGGGTNTPTGTYKKVATGRYFGCAISTADAITCWGDNSKGQTSHPPGKFTEISAGTYHACGINTSGNILCWGDNSQLQTDAPKTGVFVSVASSVYQSCGLAKSGQIWCWGHKLSASQPSASYFKQISVGDKVVCAVTTNDTAQCWIRSSSSIAQLNSHTMKQTYKINGIACSGYTSSYNQPIVFMLTKIGTVLSYGPTKGFPPYP